MPKPSRTFPFRKLLLVAPYVAVVLGACNGDRKTVSFGPYTFEPYQDSHWFTLEDWTQPDRPTKFTVNVTSSRSLEFVNEEENGRGHPPDEQDDVRIWAMLANGHGGSTSYLPMRLRFVKYGEYQAKFTGLAPDLIGAGGQKSPAAWKVRIDKRDPDNEFTIEVDCKIEFTPW